MDSTLSLAVSLNTTKGATALLLGSGISSAAGILTGWGVTLDLIKKIAAVAGENPGPAPDAWYRNRYHEEPDYAKLLEKLAPTPAERQRLLRGYFVPTAEEREEGTKVPTKAHRAIAEIVSKGYVRVILTTNFDPLLEQALEDAGIQPAVVSDASAIKGMMPLQHEPVTIIKLHGHYLDTRLRNTTEELANYEVELDGLLDRVFDEYGLLICGWSGVWDTALREAITRCPTRRFSTHWAVMGNLADEAKVLAKHRASQLIPIAGADDFFQKLAETLAALEDLNRSSPVSTAVAVATMKRYLPVEEQRIRLHELVMAEVETVWEHAGQVILSSSPTPDAIVKVVHALDALCERVVHVVATGVYWGQPAHYYLWLSAIERLGKLKHPQPSSSYSVWRELRDYPLVLLYYAVGLGAVATNNVNLLLDLLLNPKFRNEYQDRVESPGVRLFEPIDPDPLQALWPGTSKQRTPLSDHIHRTLRPAFQKLVPDEVAYDEVFDRFEYHMSLVFHDVMNRAKGEHQGYFKFGRFMWRGGWARPCAVAEEVKEQIREQGTNWPLLKRGLFEGSAVILDKAVADLDNFIKQMRH